MPATPAPPRATPSTGATSTRVRPGSRSPSTCRPRPATTPTTCWPAERSARSACRSRTSATCEALFDDIPLSRMNTSMTINATAMWLLALYVARRGAGRRRKRQLAGTTQNDIIKEYLSRGTYVFPPRPSLRLITDMVAYTVARSPSGTRRTSAATTCRRPARRRCRRSRSRCAPRSPCSTRCASPARCPPSGSAGRRPHLVLRQRRRALRRRDVQDARVRRALGRASAASATA